ncbi:WG repeat-containing protein [Aneurinibacillus aneurinilyticus]|uniref:Tetratricopeptide repeat protein n=1 Tax=Aneurinibacillus aneurinilyticus ATCC 12856 TaxID=649747 RepID=U1Y6Q5_ANEAE|nr:WG repeat-containing protein [Aneurinibacillus aneurinilyticus]ERI07822.1 tetratricopeptide repeat protein [Aneurinibacillus aneurinilyticus ATCC 12856]MED0706300.1 WG repeat-containing protein [Aneurinibacillus aneurinilyticus]MED0725288.1 WG repeat-containing protein [Aneurinibacillus aneurinilyticus]MED0732298.1 WG repeat-containing protein [Aneurinibacillus aneurinilyticus]MED0741470.1 WG repeat-containing protein [Aneurinibacillus aneurinilyticus]
MDATLIALVRRHLPPGAELSIVKEPYRKVAVCVANMDGDSIPEIIAGYKWEGHPYVMIIKHYNHVWYKAATIKGPGYDITYLNTAPITGEKAMDLLIGWQIGAIWSELNIFTYTDETLNKIVSGVYYSRIEVEDMPGKNGKDGKSEIALWHHDTGEAYRVEVYRWEDGKLISAPDVYPYYFKKVVAYYEEKVKENPQAAFYWYYLADAWLKAGMPQRALQAVDIALALHSTYPSKKELLALKEQALRKNRMRRISLYPARVKGVGGTKWGYINSAGRFIILPEYSYAYPFQENRLAIVEKKGGYGIINEAGRFIVEPKYDFIQPFFEGLAIVQDKSGARIIDQQGQEITTKPYAYIASFQEGRAVFQNYRMQYGYLDAKGREIIPAIYVYANDFWKGYAVVKVKEGQYALLNEKGDVEEHYSYAFVGSQGDGLLAFQEVEQGKYGFMDKNGRVVLPPSYTSVQPFQKGRAIVNVAEDYHNRYGVIDKAGTFIIKPQYNSIETLGEERFAVGIPIDKDRPFIGSKYAIYDSNGNQLTDFVYRDVLPYKERLASVHNDTDTFFINTSGQRARGWPIVAGTGTLSLEGDVIKANIDQRISYLNKAGETVWRENTIIPLQGAYEVQEKKYKPNKDYLVYYPQISGMADKNIQASVNTKLKKLSEVKHIPADVQLDYNYFGDFDIPFFRKYLLVFKLAAYNYPFGAAHGMPTEIYPHIDVVSGRFYELKDLFRRDANYVAVLSAIIEKQIKTNEKYSYVWQDQYKGIKPDQPFYVDDDALYIYFYPYEIAPYAAGFPTFRIPYSEIMTIIDTKGAFWQSYH